MKHTDYLTIILETNYGDAGAEIKRRFHTSFLGTTFGKGLDCLIEKKGEVKAAFPERDFPGMPDLIEKILHNDKKLFVEPQDLQWYWDLIALRIIGEKADYNIHIKGCKDYSFFDVSIRDSKSKKRKLLLSPFFHKTPLPQKATESELIRGLADTFLFLSPCLKDVFEKADMKKSKDTSEEDHKRTTEASIRDAVEWFTVDLITEEINEMKTASSTQYEIKVQATVDWDDSQIKEGKKCITVYDSFGEPDPVIVSSKNIREAIAELSQAWHNPACGSILLSAGTGSGKEVLQNILTYALSVNDVETIPLPAPQLASSQEPLEEIFRTIDKASLVSKKCSTDGRYELKREPLLFLDEIHQDSAQRLREQLLRVLEAKEITCGGKTISFKKARYLFAASEPPDELRKRNPPDFWTRIEYIIEMRHPLRLETRDEINDSLKQFFCVFWRKAAKYQRIKIIEQEIERRDKQRTGIMRTVFNTSNNSEREKADLIRDPKIEKALGIISVICPEKDDEAELSELSSVFADALDSPLIPVISIRLLRSIVNRLFSNAIYFIRTEKGKKLEDIKSEMDKWIIQIFKNIVPEIKSKGVF